MFSSSSSTDDSDNEADGNDSKKYVWRKLRSVDNSCPNMRSNTTAFWYKQELWCIGGKGVGLNNEVWTFSTASRCWKMRHCKGKLPSERDGHALALSSETGKAYIWGGQNVPRSTKMSSNAFLKIKTEYLATRCTLCDMFVLDLESETWTELFPSGVKPPTRRCHTLLYYKTNDEDTLKKFRLDYFNQRIYDGRMDEFLIMYGGSGVDPAKGTDRFLILYLSLPTYVHFSICLLYI